MSPNIKEQEQSKVKQDELTTPTQTRPRSDKFEQYASSLSPEQNKPTTPTTRPRSGKFEQYASALSPEQNKPTTPTTRPRSGKFEQYASSLSPEQNKPTTPKTRPRSDSGEHANFLAPEVVKSRTGIISRPPDAFSTEQEKGIKREQEAIAEKQSKKDNVKLSELEVENIKEQEPIVTRARR